MNGWREDLDGPYPRTDEQQVEYAAACGDPTCPEEHGDEGAHLGPWGGPVPQPKVTRRRGLARAWFVRAAIVVLAVVLVLLLGWVR